MTANEAREYIKNANRADVTSAAQRCFNLIHVRVAANGDVCVGYTGTYWMNDAELTKLVDQLLHRGHGENQAHGPGYPRAGD